MENETDPIQYPTLILGGETVEVKFRCGDIVRLDKSGVDLENAEALKAMNLSAKIQRMMTMLSAAISHKMQKTAEELADMVDLADLQRVDSALAEAIKKATPQATPQEVKPNGAIQ